MHIGRPYCCTQFGWLEGAYLRGHLRGQGSKESDYITECDQRNNQLTCCHSAAIVITTTTTCLTL